MNSKLTLSIDRSLTEKAKKYARDQGRSLSDLVENYFKVLTTHEPGYEYQVTPRLKAIKGILKVPPDYDHKKELSKILAKKHLK